MKPSILILIILLAASCRKERDISYADCSNRTNDINLVRKMIAGSYTWTHTYRYYFTYSDTLTPQSENRTEKYLFNRTGKVSYIVNSQTQWTKDYVVDYEFKVSAYPPDSAAIVIINEPRTGQRFTSFRAYLCSDSAYFYNPMSSFLNVHCFKRN